MSEQISPSTKRIYGVELVCSIWKFPRSSFYHACKGAVRGRRGKKPFVSDDSLLEAIQDDLKESPFRGEGHRKVHARIKRFKQIPVGRNRILNLMKTHKLLSPYRVDKGNIKSHDGRITTAEPNVMWATDAAKIFTLKDGWVWFFGVIDHWNSECLGWHLAKKGTRFAAIEAANQAVEKVFGLTSPGIARGLKLRTDHGSQFLSEGFVNQIQYWGMSLSKGYVKEPETNGVIERFHRTFKEQIVHGRQYQGIDDLLKAISEFIPKYNDYWILEKLQYHSPHQARILYQKGENILKSKSIFPALPEKRKKHGYFVLAAT